MRSVEMMPVDCTSFEQIGARKADEPPVKAMHRPETRPRLSGYQPVETYVATV